MTSGLIIQKKCLGSLRYIWKQQLKQQAVYVGV